MIIDLHCDTLSKIHNNKTDLEDKTLTLNKSKLEKYYLLQVFALFINDKKYKKKNLNKMIETYYKHLNENNVKKYKELIKNYKQNKYSSILALEDGGYIKSIKDLYDLNNKGVKIICLTWNYKNSLGYPHTINKPLTKLGIKTIKEMEKLNMIICVSHLSDKGFYDVYNNTTKPFIASHSNSRYIHNHTRNLTDDMIIKINERKGLIGINYYNEFLSNKKETYIEDIIKHIKHIIKISSIDVVSLGSDFDGIDNKVEFQNDYSLLYKELKNHFTEEQIDKITYLNAAKFFKKFLI